jgi:hypothetical protein
MSLSPALPGRRMGLRSPSASAWRDGQVAAGNCAGLYDVALGLTGPRARHSSRCLDPRELLCNAAEARSRQGGTLKVVRSFQTHCCKEFHHERRQEPARRT